MSSFMRVRAQIPTRESFMLSLSGCMVYTSDIASSVLNIADETHSADLSASVIYPAGLRANTLLRDMGRSLTLFSTVKGRSVKIALLREVQIVSGSGTEGVSDTTAYLTPVWVEKPSVIDAQGNMLKAMVTRCG